MKGETPDEFKIGTGSREDHEGKVNGKGNRMFMNHQIVNYANDIATIARSHKKIEDGT